ncbi:MAG: hypothetical protein JWP64_3482 [Pseudonocardia sp.]|jgi:hypothetical protein|uniref:DUF4097 family beta strand repeat-containing protein n=1 Tax=Pseudonocardia sp. TaxID=60912 RepID=UPI0026267325|nr:DUF4097 family beta strand repeat-containing protein [Pseudonocardia sp.]MCU1628533.1 hypothetical protein [Pseudonocardia sp.]MDT7699607.1 hypothetical protein [Pseudonocardiales bacterium]
MRVRRLLLILAAGLLAGGCSVQGVSIGPAAVEQTGGDVRTATTTNSHDGPVSRVEIVSDAGDVDLHAGAAAGARVGRTARWTGPEPEVTEALDGDVLRITVHCPSPAETCSVGLAVEVPAATATRVQLGAGSIAVTGLTGAHSLSTAAGSVAGTGLGAEKTSARAAAGDVDLTFSGAPAQVEAESTAGNVTVLVPVGPVYRVDARTTVGRVDVRVADDPGADAVITARSTTGDVTVAHA